MGSSDSLALHNQQIDSTGGHYRYKQYYKGLEVEDAHFALHTYNGWADVANSTLVPGLSFNTGNPIPEAQALQAATAAIGATEYAWQNADYQEGYRLRMDDSNAVFVPHGRLVIGRISHAAIAAPSYVFAWRFHLEVTAPEKDVLNVLVDAHTGQVIDIATDRQESYCDNGTADVYYYGWKYNLEVTSCTFCSRWVLQDCRKIYTEQDGRAIYNKDKVFTSVGVRGAVSAHWVAERVWDYFGSYWGCNGSDGRGTLLRIEKSSTGYGASFHPSQNTMSVGNASNNNPYSTYDVIAHEFTHGTTYRTSGLIYEKESGALNESFSDIFGKVFERHMKNVSMPAWGLGTDAGVTVRNMSNPRLFNHPDHYQGTYWYNLTNCTPTQQNDNCGVHINSGVQNKWFYLLSNAIGFDKAARIAWYNLTLYLRPNSGYADAKMGSITAAKRLYGECSNEAKATITAWRQVGVTQGVSGLHRTCYDDVVYGPIDVVAQPLPKMAPPKTEIHIFPNPSTGIIIVELPTSTKEALLEVYTVTGQRIFSTMLTNGTQETDLSFLPAGTYSISVTTDGFHHQQKLAIIH